MNKKTMLTALIISSMAMSVGAVDNTVGTGSGIAYGAGSHAPKVENIAIGGNASISYSNGNSNATGDIVVGKDANINNYASQGGSVAIGKNAKVENMAGGQEASFAFGQTSYSGGMFSSSRIPSDPTKVVGSVVVGDNTFARTGSTMVGSHNYIGELGDTTVDTATTRKDNLGVYATTVGANSFSNGAFITNTGTYNIVSSDYKGGRSDDMFGISIKNMGATVNGSFNSIESKTADGYGAGIANTVTGVANRTFNTNGTLVYGAGNVVTNSIGSLSGFPTSGGNSAKDFSNRLRDGVRSSHGAGATMVFGGGNVADYTKRTSIIGVNNVVAGDSTHSSEDNFVVGYQNTGVNLNGTTVIGSNRSVANTNNTVIIGNVVDSTGSITASNAVAIGTDTNVLFDGGVALGSKSYSNRSANENGGYDVVTKMSSSDTSSVWKPTDSAVSVGNGSDVTRRITSVAAGLEDTDAVNVAQLKRVVDIVGDNSLQESKSYTDKEVGKVGASSNALAGLKFLDYNPNDKWSFATSLGHYQGSSAVALGVAYQPNANVMLHGGVVLDGKSSYNIGASFKVGKGGAKVVDTNAYDMIKRLQEDNEQLRKELEDIKFMLNNK